ncbi:TPA: DUF1642 domain-containing protein [Streptococcus suis]|nr:DUF1642 domain-containing protein [Streptococcus suis]HEM3585440.1 DUF1642 domain-containing protein [Streptococcus suis]
MNKQEAIEEVTELFGDSIQAKAFRNIIRKLHEPQKVVVPTFIDSYIRYAKDEGMSLFIAMDNAQNKESGWIIDNEETFARAWFDGYEIEQEKLYTVELFNGQPLVEANNVLYFGSDLTAPNAYASKDKLKKAGFGWVFDCKGVKVEEVEEN